MSWFIQRIGAGAADPASISCLYSLTAASTWTFGRPRLIVSQIGDMSLKAIALEYSHFTPIEFR